MGQHEKPKFLEVAAYLEGLIKERGLKPGDKLYSENELVSILNVTRQTVRHGIKVLEDQGLIKRVQGSGTYLNDSRQSILIRRKRVAVVITYEDDYIFPRTIAGIKSVMVANGYTFDIHVTNNRIANERKILQSIIKKDEVGGVIMEAIRSGLPNANKYLYQEIKKLRIPVVFINSYYPGLKFPHVSIDDKMAGKAVTRHLIINGHRKIAGVFKLDDGQGHLRYAGYMQAMAEAKLAVDDENIIWLDTEDLKRMDLIWEKIQSRMRGCTAITCYNDEVAYELICLFQTHGIVVPEDISIVSIDNSDLIKQSSVALTSVPHPMEHLGQKAAQNIVRMIYDPDFDGNYEFEVHVISRQSVKKLS